MKETIDYINKVQVELEEQYPVLKHSVYWWGEKVKEEGEEVALSAIDPQQATLEQWQHMREEFGDALLSLLRYGHMIGLTPSDMFDQAIASFNKTRLRAEEGYYPRKPKENIVYTSITEELDYDI